MSTERQRISDEQWFAENGYLAGGGIHLDAETLGEFSELVRPLEEVCGKPLNGPGRQSCLRAFRENPDAFAKMVSAAFERANRNPLGLLIHMVMSGDHRLNQP